MEGGGKEEKKKSKDKSVNKERMMVEFLDERG